MSDRWYPVLTSQSAVPRPSEVGAADRRAGLPRLITRSNTESTHPSTMPARTQTFPGSRTPTPRSDSTGSRLRRTASRIFGVGTADPKGTDKPWISWPLGSPNNPDPHIRPPSGPPSPVTTLTSHPGKSHPIRPPSSVGSASVRSPYETRTETDEAEEQALREYETDRRRTSAGRNAVQTRGTTRHSYSASAELRGPWEPYETRTAASGNEEQRLMEMERRGSFDTTARKSGGKFLGSGLRAGPVSPYWKPETEIRYSRRSSSSSGQSAEITSPVSPGTDIQFYEGFGSTYSLVPIAEVSSDETREKGKERVEWPLSPTDRDFFASKSPRGDLTLTPTSSSPVSTRRPALTVSTAASPTPRRSRDSLHSTVSTPNTSPLAFRNKRWSKMPDNHSQGDRDSVRSHASGGLQEPRDSALGRRQLANPNRSHSSQSGYQRQHREWRS